MKTGVLATRIASTLLVVSTVLGGCTSAPATLDGSTTSPLSSSDSGLGAGLDGWEDLDRLVSQIPEDLPALQWLRWTSEDSLHVAFEGDQLLVFDFQFSRTLKRHYFSAKVLGASHDASMIFVDQNEQSPALLLRADDGEELLRLNEFAPIEEVVFRGDDQNLFAIDQEGRVHIWRQARDLLTLPDEPIQTFLARQLPDFTVHLDGADQSVLWEEPLALLQARRDGILSFWSPNEPEEVNFLARATGSLRSLQRGQHLGAAITVERDLLVFRVPSGGLYQWAAPLQADRLALSEESNLGFLLREQSLYYKDFETGEVLDEWELKGKNQCGIALSADSQKIALCIDQRLFVIQLESSELLGWFDAHQESFLED